MSGKTIRCSAPAKINLYLRVCGKLPEGYHALDSVVMFSDIADHLTLQASPSFQFNISGPFASSLLTEPFENNLVVRAVRFFCKTFNTSDHLSVTLHKNLPVAAGIGGGSSDAAATIKALADFYNVSPAKDRLDQMLMELGSDVPVCNDGTPVRILGAGDKFIPVETALGGMPVLLINPGKACPTANVFQQFNPPFSEKADLPQRLSLEDLRLLDNDLKEAALQIVPEIEECITLLESFEGCLHGNLSGSGATCYGIFDSESSRDSAMKAALRANPGWWVACGHIL